MNKLFDQLEQAIESNDRSDTVRFWLWLKICMGGECTVEEALKSGLPSVVDSCNSLFASGRIRIKGDSIRWAPYLKTAPAKDGEIMAQEEEEIDWIDALEAPKGRHSKKALAEIDSWIFSAYNDCRKKNGVKELPSVQKEKNSRHWRSIAHFLIGNKIDPAKFFNFTFENTRWQKTAFPAPSLFSGDWVITEWIDKDGSSAKAHAGKTYKSDPSLRTALEGAGFDVAGFDEAKLRHILGMAHTLKKVPHLREPHKEPLMEEIIQWTAKNHES